MKQYFNHLRTFLLIFCRLLEGIESFNEITNVEQVLIKLMTKVIY